MMSCWKVSAHIQSTSCPLGSLISQMMCSHLQVGSVKRPSEDSATPETKRTRSMSQVSGSMSSWFPCEDGVNDHNDLSCQSLNYVIYLVITQLLTCSGFSFLEICG